MRIEHTDTTISFKGITNEVFRSDDATTLKLENVELVGTDDDMLAFSKALRGHPSLKTFHLTNVKVAEEGLSLNQVVSVIFVTVSVESVRIDNVSVESSALATAAYCSSLKELLLPNLGLKDDDAVTIAAAVGSSSSIETVDLTGNMITDIGCASFIKALEKNTSIKTIKLDGNGDISISSRSAIQTELSSRSAMAA